MELPEYLKLVASKLETSDKEESIRLINLLINTLIEVREKIQ